MINNRGDATPILAMMEYQLRKIYSSETIRCMAALPHRSIIFLKQHRNKPIFSIELQTSFGFFATLQVVLFILTYCEENDRLPDITAKGGLYGDPEGRVDWFACYFERTKSYSPELEGRLRRKDDILTTRVANVRQLGFRSRYEHTLKLCDASHLFAAYYRPNAHISEEVDVLVGKLSISNFTLGVHYRGTDKARETGRVSWEVFVVAIRKTLANEPRISSILVSSDEWQFLNYIRLQAFACLTTYIPSSHVSTTDKPVHYSGHDGFQIGREALVASLLLSRCGFLLKTASYLSAWSKIFNPSLKVLLISPPGVQPGWFPDSALWASQREPGGETHSTPAFAWYSKQSFADSRPFG